MAPKKILLSNKLIQNHYFPLKLITHAVYKRQADVRRLSVVTDWVQKLWTSRTISFEPISLLPVLLLMCSTLSLLALQLTITETESCMKFILWIAPETFRTLPNGYCPLSRLHNGVKNDLHEQIMIIWINPNCIRTKIIKNDFIARCRRSQGRRFSHQRGRGTAKRGQNPVRFHGIVTCIVTCRSARDARSCDIPLCNFPLASWLCAALLREYKNFIRLYDTQ